MAMAILTDREWPLYPFLSSIPLEVVAAPVDKKTQPLLPTTATVATKTGSIFKEKRVYIMQWVF